MAAPRSEEEASPQVERLWPARLRWRLRGAWQWPAFLVLTVVDGLLLELLPPYGSGPGGVLPGILLAGFANLLLVAVVGPLVGRLLLRRWRRDLPRQIADDYAGTALMCALLVFLVLAGLAHRPAVASDDRDHRAVFAAVHDYVRAHAPGLAGLLASADALRLDEHYYRACLPTGEVRRAFCLLVDTGSRPADVREDTDRTPNRDWRRFP
jgi:hypothetical protein